MLATGTTNCTAPELESSFAAIIEQFQLDNTKRRLFSKRKLIEFETLETATLITFESSFHSNIVHICYLL